MNGSPNQDAELLRQYAGDGSEQAFRELVQRHIQMVNCTARRIVAGDAHLAQDVIQMVFTDLARKARSLPTGVVLGGWLHRHTCYTAANIVRAESRRRVREKHAVDMETLNQTPSNDALWQKLTPVLDEALNHLASHDRDAIVLRYLEQQDLRSIGQVLGTSENTTHMRITRALEKLRIFLERRGVTFSAALLATTLDAGAATMAPLPALVSTVSTHALTTAAASTGFTLTTLHNMIISKSRLSVAAALVLVGLVVTYLIQNKLHTPAPKAVEAITAPTRKVALSSPLPAQQQPVVVTLTPVTTPQPPPQDAGSQNGFRNFALPAEAQAYLMNLVGATSTNAGASTASANPIASGNSTAVESVDANARVEFGSSDGDNIKNALVLLGVNFPPGSKFSYNADIHTITVFNTLNNIEKLNNVLKQLAGASMAQANSIPVTTPQSPPQDASTTQSNVFHKLISITVPVVNFDPVALDRLLHSLAVLSAQYDPDQVGVNLVVIPRADGTYPVIPLSLRDANLGVILNKVAEVAGYSYTIGDSGIIVFRANTGNVATLSVPPISNASAP